MTSFPELRVDQLAEQLSNQIWLIVKEWNFFAPDPIGKQIVRGR